MPHRPIPTSRLEVETTTLATDRSSESWTKAVGRDGWLIGATIIMSAGSSTKRGALRTLGFLTGATGGPDDVRAFLAGGYLYDGFSPAGYGALPVTATDQFTLLTRNIQTSMRVRLILWIADENPGAIGWQQNVDPRTDGFIRTVTGANPAAGANASDAVPTDAAWRLLAYTIVLVTDATVANRRTDLVVDDGTSTNRRAIVMNPTSSSQAASLTRTWTFQRGNSSIAAGGFAGFGDTQTLIMNDSIVEHGRLTEGYRLRTVTDSLQAGDDYAAPSFQVEETIEP